MRPPASQADPSEESLCDVLVIGGGPAGSTAAALLAEKGHRVTLLEKDRHPRFHIGESLLPANLPLLERLGVLPEVEAIGQRKLGAELVSPWHEHQQSFELADAWDKSMPSAFQVRRSEFDRILIDNAQRKGAEVIQGCRVREGRRKGTSPSSGSPTAGTGLFPCPTGSPASAWSPGLTT